MIIVIFVLILFLLAVFILLLPYILVAAAIGIPIYVAHRYYKKSSKARAETIWLSLIHI